MSFLLGDPKTPRWLRQAPDKSSRYIESVPQDALFSGEAMGIGALGQGGVCGFCDNGATGGGSGWWMMRLLSADNREGQNRSRSTEAQQGDSPGEDWPSTPMAERIPCHEQYVQGAKDGLIV